MNNELNTLLVQADKEDRQAALRTTIRRTTSSAQTKNSEVIVQKMRAFKQIGLIIDKPIARKVKKGSPSLFTGKNKRPILADLSLGETVFFPSSHSRGAQSRVNGMIKNFKNRTSTSKRFTYRQVTENNVTGYRVWRVS